MLQPHPKLGDIFHARLKSMAPEELEALLKSVNPQNMAAMLKLLPELRGTIGNAAQRNSQPQMAPQHPPMPMMQHAPPPQMGKGTQGFKHGGMVLDRDGYANKGIPNQGFARGGFPLPRVAPPPHASAIGTGLPAEMKTASRKYNTPTFAGGGLVQDYANGGGVSEITNPIARALLLQKMGHIDQSVNPNFSRLAQQGQAVQPINKATGGSVYPGPTPEQETPSGSYAGGGPVGPQGPQGLMANPEMAQKMAMQNAAMQAVPPSSKSDSIPANLSQNEFVMCAPSVMWFGMQKLAKMQEQAHQGLAEHMAMQHMQQQEGPPGQQPPQAPPQAAQGGQQPQRPPMGLAAPPPGMARAVQNANGAPMPNPMQQRIAATDTPRPPGNPLSAIH